MEIEDKSGDLLGKTEEVDGSVEQSRLKLLFEINLPTAIKVSAVPAELMPSNDDTHSSRDLERPVM